MRTLLSYLGWRRFPPDMSAFEVRHFFSFSVADKRESRVRYPRRLRLDAALQVGFVRMTGTTLDSFDYVPNTALKHVATVSRRQSLRGDIENYKNNTVALSGCSLPL